MIDKKRWIGVDLFAGVGGMSLGFENAGINVAVAVDADDVHTQVHLANFPHSKFICSDITTLNSEEIKQVSGGQIHVLFGGPPCQGFSMIGKRETNDPRNELIFEFLAMIKKLQPYYFVIENVKGMLQGKAISYLHDFVKRIEKLDYLVVKPIRVLDASDFGIPQRRERVFILGYAKGLPPPSYPEPLTASGSKITVWDALSDLPNIDEYPELLISNVFKGQLGEPSLYAALLRDETMKGLSGCLRTIHTPETQKRFSGVAPGQVDTVSRFYRLKKDGLSPTLRAGTGKDRGSFMAARPIHPVYERCISVREAARLHSFPDWFQFHPTKWHGFRQIGNSVPPFLAREVAKKIVEALKLIS